MRLTFQFLTSLAPLQQSLQSLRSAPVCQESAKPRSHTAQTLLRTHSLPLCFQERIYRSPLTVPCCCFTISESSKTLELIGTFELIYLVQTTRFTDERVCFVPFLVPRRTETKRLVLRNPYMKKRHEFSVLQ